MVNNKEKLLIVNDSPLFRSHLRSLLGSRYDLEIVELNTCRLLRSFFNKYDPRQVALAVIDTDLPDGNGLEVLEERAGDSSTFPFIVIGTIYNRSLVVRAVKMGAVDIVGKPVKTETIMGKISGILAGKEKQEPEDVKTARNFYREIRVEIKRALRGRYHLTVFLLSLVWTGDADLPDTEKTRKKEAFLSMMQKTMRETDAVFPLSLTDFLLVLPFTDSGGSSVVEQKIARGLQEISDTGKARNYRLAAASLTIPEGTDFKDSDVIVDNKTIDRLISSLEKDFKEALK